MTYKTFAAIAAAYRPDVEVAGNEEILSKVFVRRPIIVEEHF